MTQMLNRNIIMLREDSPPEGGQLMPPVSLSSLGEKEGYDRDRAIAASQGRTLKALLLKSASLQSRNWCSLLCQVISPILCLLFTLAVRQIVGGITTGAVYSNPYPQPLSLPLLDSLIRPQLGLSCQQLYYFQSPPSDSPFAEYLMRTQLKEVCPDGGLSPKFSRVDSVNAAVMSCLEKANTLAFERGDDLNTDIPDGTVRFLQANKNAMRAVLGINDYRLPEYHKNNGATKIVVKTSQTTTISTYLRVTEGLLGLIERLTKAFLLVSDGGKESKEVIAGSIMYMPFSGEDKTFVSKMVNVIGSGLYPLGLSLLLPLLLYTLVSEKEQRQLQMMRMNGLQMRSYWLNYFIVSFAMSLTCAGVMFLAGRYIIQVTFFVSTSWGLLWAIFIGWAIAQLSMAALVQIFIDSAKSATIVGYVLSIFSTLIGIPICTVIFPTPMTLPFLLTLYPPLALSRIVYILGSACADSIQCIRNFSDASGELILCIGVLYGWVLMFLLAVYMNQMVQQEYGVAKRPPWLEKTLKYIRRNREEGLLAEQSDSAEGQSEGENEIEMAEMQRLTVSRAQNAPIDHSVTQHAQLLSSSPVSAFPLVTKGLSKRYTSDNGQKGKIALRPFTLGIQKGEIFGLLGPNGAGKTTLISVLTGMYPQTSGAAWIAAQSIGFSETNKNIGVCPQFDILWRELTIEEHLLFYARMKGVPAGEEERAVREALEEVDLWERRAMQAGELSGGMQRRLSIAVALVGKPSVVFLDEPSSGLDPLHRRQIWDILLKCKRKTAILLTSHLMDEVEHLCDRIGVISQGTLRCVGGIQQLKHRFGKGYKLVLSYPGILREGGVPPVVRILREEWKLQVVNELQTRLTLRIAKEDIPRCLQLMRQQEEVVWSIDQPSLYDVFTHFVR